MSRWNDLAKQRQAELCRQQRPWLESSGPRSDYGRSVSSKNAAKKKRTLSQQLHFTVTPPCEKAAEVALDVTLMSLQTNEGDIDRQLEIGDRALYVGHDPAIASICGGKKLEIFAIRESWAICWVTGVPGLVTVPLGDLKSATLG
jgi:hypothetical protein